MDNLHVAASESQMRLHDTCFEKCVTSLNSNTLDATEEKCLRSCFKSFAITTKLAMVAMRNVASSAEAMK
jgi:hypothetical protein